MLLLGRSRSISRSSWSSAPIRLLRNCSAVKRCTQAGRVTAPSVSHFGLLRLFHLACNTPATSAAVLTQPKNVDTL